MTSLELMAWLRDTHERGASSLGCEQAAAEIAMLRTAVFRVIENIDHWLVTGEEAGAEESRAIYEQLCAAICRVPVEFKEHTT